MQRDLHISAPGWTPLRTLFARHYLGKCEDVGDYMHRNIYIVSKKENRRERGSCSGGCAEYSFRHLFFAIETTVVPLDDLSPDVRVCVAVTSLPGQIQISLDMWLYKFL